MSAEMVVLISCWNHLKVAYKTTLCMLACTEHFFHKISQPTQKCQKHYKWDVACQPFSLMHSCKELGSGVQRWLTQSAIQKGPTSSVSCRGTSYPCAQHQRGYIIWASISIIDQPQAPAVIVRHVEAHYQHHTNWPWLTVHSRCPRPAWLKQHHSPASLPRDQKPQAAVFPHPPLRYGIISKRTLLSGIKSSLELMPM